MRWHHIVEGDLRDMRLYEKSFVPYAANNNSAHLHITRTSCFYLLHHL